MLPTINSFMQGLVVGFGASFLVYYSLALISVSLGMLHRGR